MKREDSLRKMCVLTAKVQLLRFLTWFAVPIFLGYQQNHSKIPRTLQQHSFDAYSYRSYATAKYIRVFGVEGERKWTFEDIFSGKAKIILIT